MRSREVLAEALIHSLRGLDEEGLAHLHEADRLALEDDDPISSAQARAELGYVDFLRARYDRAELWLTESLALADGFAVGAGEGHHLPGLGAQRSRQLPASDRAARRGGPALA